MIKIGIMTFHRADNYGAVLQAYALLKTINKIGGNDVKCEIIDYKNYLIENRYQIKKINQLCKMRSKVKHCLLRRYKIANRKNYEMFRKEYLEVSDTQYTLNNIKQANEIYDVFITGSDQVWNGLLTGNDDSYFLDFVLSDKGRMSYAASIGAEEYAFKDSNRINKYLKEYDFISVRENEALDKIKQLGFSNTTRVLDPTFLLSTVDYDKLILEKPIQDKKYILLYVIAVEKEVYKFAKKLASITSCKIVYINADQFAKCGVHNERNVSVSRFLQLIKHAEYVVTSSFHGVALSLIYNKEFYYQLSNSKNNFNSRIETLIKMAGVTKRNIMEIDTSLEKIEWVEVNNNLEREKQLSILFLQNCINSFKHKGNLSGEE